MSYDDDPRFNARGGRRSLRRDLSSGFRRAIGLTLLGTAVPGAGLTQTRSRRWGLLLLGGFVLGIAALAWLVFSGRVRSVGGTLASKDAYLYAFAVAVGVIGVVWCASIIATAVLVRPRSLDRAPQSSTPCQTPVVHCEIEDAAQIVFE